MLISQRSEFKVQWSESNRPVLTEILKKSLNKVLYSQNYVQKNYFEAICGLRGSNGSLMALNDSSDYEMRGSTEKTWRRGPQQD